LTRQFSLMTIYLINFADPDPVALIGMTIMTMLVYIRFQLKFNKYAFCIITVFTGGCVKYAISTATYHEKVHFFTLIGIFFIIPSFTVFAYHFRLAFVSACKIQIQPTTIFGLWITTMLFDSSVDDDKIIKYKINYENENIKNKIK
jgi:hypothetical protein